VRGAIRSSVRARLVLLFFTITASAVAFVYLYVVPQLSSSLTAERLQRLEAAGAEELPRFEAAAKLPQDPARLARLAQRSSAVADARVTLLGVRGGEPEFVLADSQSDAGAVLGEYPTAIGAIDSGSINSGVSGAEGVSVAQTSVPVADRGETVWVAVYSTPLAEVESNVALIRRQIIIAGAIALVAALLAAYLAAGAHARRLRRLEDAAEEVAQGNFSVPIPVDSNDEVGQLAMTFDEMQSRLARLDSARREFIANASHELRTPIASLGGFLELLEEDDPDEESRKEFMRTMRGQVSRLERLAADLLDLSRIDADAISLRVEAVDLEEVAAEAAGEFAAVAARADTEISLAEPEGDIPLARADRTRTTQIMRILIDNAIKHTPDEATITITTSNDAETATVEVTDNGPGIPEENIQRIFERFHTGDSGAGSGLGLAISRELARLMGGDLRVASRPGHTTFSLTLPAARPEGADPVGSTL
jgi:two-component system OmpR family sensor kinase